MTARNQYLEIYSGDACSPIVAVTDGTGAPVDLSAAGEIKFLLKDLNGSVVLTKLYSNASISFVGDGTDGMIQIAIATGETADLEGDYAMQVMVFDSSEDQSTTMTGVTNIAPH